MRAWVQTSTVCDAWPLCRRRVNTFATDAMSAAVEVGGFETIRVLIVADIRLFREGLDEVLGREERLEVVAAVADPLAAIAVLEHEEVGIVLLGMTAGDRTHAMTAIGRAHPQARVVALAVEESADDVVPLAEMGIAGYVPRDASLGDLVDTIECVSGGGMPCSPGVAAALARRLSVLSADARPPAGDERLTAREVQVLRLIGEGLSNKEIATRLCIEVPTVKNHVHNVLEKLHVNRRAEAVAAVRRVGWV
jgi:two-component system, NarL family, nitrate/nitrite response regulator NarL